MQAMPLLQLLVGQRSIITGSAWSTTASLGKTAVHANAFAWPTQQHLCGILCVAFGCSICRCRPRLDFLESFRVAHLVNTCATDSCLRIKFQFAAFNELFNRFK